MVAVIAPEFPLPPHLRFGGEDATLNTDTSLERVSDYLRAQPKPLVSQWTVAGARKSRFPEADIHEIDGVLFYLPHDIAERVNGRVLILKAGVLQFDPPLEPLVTES